MIKIMTLMVAMMITMPVATIGGPNEALSKIPVSEVDIDNIEEIGQQKEHEKDLQKEENTF